MKTLRLILAGLPAIVVVSMLSGGCSELKDTLPAGTNPAIAVHADGWTNPASANFHGKAIMADSWDMRSCRTCHGTDYSGGVADVSCRTCHTDGAGPENCATCHGGPTTSAPPEDLAGNTGTSAPGVGAHQKHVKGGDLSSLVWCYECHTVPTSVYAAGHVDSDLPAEVPMNGPLARTASAGIIPAPSHDYAALTCSDTYCHGNWRAAKATSPNQFAYTDSVMTGANAMPVWTGGSSEAACGTCHGLPPTGHMVATITGCVSCHAGVVDAQGKIADKSLHMNGKINVFGSERSF
jgi:predicted CxxxxCH...CXXCH cytochrome family protein